MYLDDGVSRGSAPNSAWLATSEADPDTDMGKTLIDAYGDKQAASAFRQVVVTQNTVRRIDDETRNWNDLRRIEIFTSPFSGFSDEEVEKSIGTEYRVAVWHPVNIDIDTVRIQTTDGCSASFKPSTNRESRVTLLRVPTGEKVRAVIEILNDV